MYGRGISPKEIGKLIGGRSEGTMYAKISFMIKKGMMEKRIPMQKDGISGHGDPDEAEDDGYHEL